MHDEIEYGKIGVGSVCNKYSAINQKLRIKHKTNANKWATLRIFMKNVTKHYVPRQTIIMEWEDIDSFFQELAGTKDHFDRLTLVTVSLMYFGLLRQGEVLQVSIDNVRLNEKEHLIHIEFNKRKKSRARGFSYTIPTFLYTIFKQYIDELHPKSSGEHFLKNRRANKKGVAEGKRI